MKLKKILLTIILTFIMILLTNTCKAYTVTANDVKAKEGEEFTITLNVSEETPLANGHIKFDSSKVEFVKASQEGMTAEVQSNGDLAWMYIDSSSFSGVDNIKGVKTFEFVFKSKSSKNSKMTLEGLEFVDVKGNEYTMNDIENLTTTIQVNKSNNMMLIVIAVIAVVLIGLFVLKSKKSK